MIKTWTPEEIKDLRRKTGLPQVKFKDLMGISLTYLQFLEIGKKKPPSMTLRILLNRIEREFEEKGEVRIG